MFDNAIFDDPLNKKGGAETVSEPEAPPLPPPPPTYTAEQVIAARQEAWQAGLASGLTQSREGIEYHLTLALSHLAMVADQWIAAETNRIAAQERETLDIALALAQKFFPVLAEAADFEMIRHAVLTHLLEHPWQPTLNITVPVGTHEKLKTHLDAALASRGLETRYQIIEDAALQPTNCYICWHEGGKQVVLERIWPVLERISAEVLAGRHPTGEQPPLPAAAATVTAPPLSRFVLPDMPPPDDTIPQDINRLPSWMVPYDHALAVQNVDNQPPATPVTFQQLDNEPAPTDDLAAEATATAPDHQQLHSLEENQA